MLLPSDALFLRGSPDGIHQLRELAGTHGWQPPEAAEDIGDQAKQMVWLVERGVHPVVALALGESDEVVVRFVVQEGSAGAGRTLRELQLRTEPDFLVFAVRRVDRYVYRPRSGHRLEAGDEVIAHGTEEGRELLAGCFGGV